MAPEHCPFCGEEMAEAWRYERRPEGETRFAALEGRPYRRAVMRCPECEHHTSSPPLDPDELYRDAYVDATYGPDGLRATFDRIMALPASRSDNRRRVARVVRFMSGHGRAGARRALDIGSGLAVFPAALAREGWVCTALDPDPRAAEHAASIEGVRALCGGIEDVDPLPDHDLVTLNKVLEHVEDPVLMLERAAEFLAADGTIYVEVPDGPAAAAEGPQREEFFIEHLHVFSEPSFRSLASRSGLGVLQVERLHEPSGKYTLAGFLAPR